MRINDVSEDRQINAVSQNPWLLISIVDPSEAVKLAAVTRFGDIIQHIPDPSTAVQLAAVTETPGALVYITDPEQSVAIRALLGMVNNRQFHQVVGDNLRRIYTLHPEWEDLQLMADEIGVEL